jgi:hypothetical protein
MISSCKYHPGPKAGGRTLRLDVHEVGMRKDWSEINVVGVTVIVTLPFHSAKFWALKKSKMTARSRGSCYG